MKNKKLSTFPTMLFVIKLYIKNAPLKLLWECLLNAAKNIMVVVTSVWLLQYLTELIFNGASFVDALIPLCIVVSANIIIDIMYKFYTNCVKPQSDLKIKTYYEKIILNHAKQLPLHCYENSGFYTNVQQAQDGVSAVFLAYNEFVKIISLTSGIVSAIKVAIDIDPFFLLFVVFTIPMIIINKCIGKISAVKRIEMKLFDRKKDYSKKVLLEKNFSR